MESGGTHPLSLSYSKHRGSLTSVSVRSALHGGGASRPQGAASTGPPERKELPRWLRNPEIMRAVQSVVRAHERGGLPRYLFWGP